MEKQYLPELISGDRVSLKKHAVELAEKMYQYVIEDRERLARFLPWPNFIKSVNDEIDFIKKCTDSWDKQEAAHFGIFRNSDDEYMGNILSFRLNWLHHGREIGYWILGKFERNGYMSDAVTILENILFEMGFNRIVIRCDPLNKRSNSIPRKLNYFYE